MVIAEIGARLKFLNNRYKTEAGTSRSAFIVKYLSFAVASTARAVKKYGNEAVVNADAGLRGEGKVSICAYVQVTQRNIRRNNETSPNKPVYFTVGKCNKNPEMASQPQFLAQAGDGTPPAGTSEPLSDPSAQANPHRQATSLPPVRRPQPAPPRRWEETETRAASQWSTLTATCYSTASICSGLSSARTDSMLPRTTESSSMACTRP